MKQTHYTKYALYRNILDSIRLGHTHADITRNLHCSYSTIQKALLFDKVEDFRVEDLEDSKSVMLPLPNTTDCQVNSLLITTILGIIDENTPAWKNKTFHKIFNNIKNEIKKLK